MRKIILSLLVLITIFPIASIGQSTQYIVGTPSGSNTGTTYPAPFANWYWGTRQQYLILASELTALGATEGNIKEIAFNVVAMNAVPSLQNYTVWLNTESPTVSLNAWEGNMGSPIYGPTTKNVTSGWNTIIVPDIPWNGTDNIVIEMCSNNSSFLSNGNASTQWASGLPFNASRTYRADNPTNCGNPSTSNLLPTNRPIIRLEIEPSAIANSAGISEIVYPKNPLCGSIDNRVWVNLINSGDSILDSVNISYQVIRPGSPTPLPLRTFKYYGPLFPGEIDSNVALPNLQGGFQQSDTLYVFTTLPNGIPDSLNADDSLMIRMINGFSGGRFIIGDTSASASLKADFPNFTTATQFLDSVEGICDSVIFEVIDSVFSEQFTINNILGTSPSIPIIFRALDGPSSSARVNFSTQTADSNFTVNLNGAKNIIFENLAFRNSGGLVTPPGGSSLAPYGIVVDGKDVEGIIFDNCNFIGSGEQSTSDNLININFENSSNLSIINSQITGGSIGLNNSKGSNTNIENTRFRNQYSQGAHFNAMRGIKFKNNNLASNSAYFPSSASDIASALVEFNKISGGIMAEGNYLSATDEFPLNGFLFSDSKAKSNNKNYLFNNFIGIGASYSGAEFKGIAVESSDFTVVSNNNLALEGNDKDSYVMFIDGGSQNEIYNNNLVHFGIGKALYIGQSSSVFNSNNNNLFSNGINLIEYNGATFVNLVTWQNLGYDNNSISVNPQYYNTPNDLHVCNLNLNGKGLKLPFFLTDIDNDLKDQNTPDIGADEFTPVAEFSLGPDTGLCIGQVLTLTGGKNTGDINIWSTGDTVLTLMVTSPGSYYISLLNECGVKEDTISVTYQIPVSIPSDTNICKRQEITVSANISNVNYNWNTGETTQSIKVNSPGLYIISVEDVYGCISKDTLEVTQSDEAQIVGKPIICGNQTTFLEANPTNSIYSWSTGASTNIITVSSQGLYSVEVNDKGCISRDTVLVTPNQLSNADYTFVTNNLTFDVTSNNSIGDVHFWDFGDGNTSSLKEPTHIYAGKGIYEVTYSVSNICDTSSISETIEIFNIGINEGLNNKGVKVYPNPSQGQFNIEIPSLQSETLTISLHDLKGSVVNTKTLSNSSKSFKGQINYQNVSPGFYILKINGDNLNFIHRVEILD